MMRRAFSVTWPAHCLLCLIAAGGLVGCSPKEPTARGPEQRRQRPLPRTVEHPDGSLEIEFGDLVLLIPRERYGFGVSPSDSDPGNPRLINWWLRWPGLEPWPRPQPGAGPPTPEQLADTVQLEIVSMDATGDPAHMPGGTIPFEEQLGTGPFDRPDLSLHEYRPSNYPHGMLTYVSPDPTFLTFNGQRPYALCSPTTTWDSGGYARCIVHGHFSPYVGYRYTFTSKWLKDWVLIETTMQQFLEKIIVNRS